MNLVFEIKFQNEKVAFAPNPIPPPPPQKSIFRTEKSNVSWMYHRRMIIKYIILKLAKFERNPTKIKLSSLIKIIFQYFLGMKALTELKVNFLPF